jgi:hypothetical protein
MKTLDHEDDSLFSDAVRGLIAGDFSRLDPLFQGQPCQIVEWFEAKLFADEPKALDEALTCACFNGRTDVVDYLLAHGVEAPGGDQYRVERLSLGGESWTIGSRDVTDSSTDST